MTVKRPLWIALTALIAVGSSAPAQVQPPNTLSAHEKQQGWRLLFNGRNLDGWHSYLQKQPGSDWSVVDGAIQLSKTNQDPPANYADLVTDQQFANFDLKLEWKARPCIDSGVMFYVHESPQYPDTYDTGVEMQIADRTCTVPDSHIAKEHSGDIFDVISDSGDWVKPAGEWNSFEILANHGHLRLFQNGHEVINTHLWDAHWQHLIAGTKFVHMPGYSKYHIGHISLQGTEPKGEPGDKLWFRNIMIRTLPDDKPGAEKTAGTLNP